MKEWCIHIDGIGYIYSMSQNTFYGQDQDVKEVKTYEV